MTLERREAEGVRQAARKSTHLQSPDQMVKTDEKRLLDLFDRLTSEQQDKLIAFAEFLAVGAAQQDAEPVSIPRPVRETVTMAIRRLIRTYPMLDRRRLMSDAAQLLAQHALEGRPSAQVIDELEGVFARHFGEHSRGRKTRGHAS